MLICIKVKSKQRLGTETIRTKIQPSKPKREITNITNSFCIKEIRKQRLGTEAIRTQIQPSKPKREVTNITNSYCIKVRSKQRLGTEAIRTQIQPSKPKREITYIIVNSQYLKENIMVNRVSSNFRIGGHSATDQNLNSVK